MASNNILLYKATLEFKYSIEQIVEKLEKDILNETKMII